MMERYLALVFPTLALLMVARRKGSQLALNLGIMEHFFDCSLLQELSRWLLQESFTPTPNLQMQS